MGISIWIMPSSEDRAQLIKLMNQSIPPETESSKPTSTGSYPPFEPHITLASFPSTIPLSSIVAAVPSASGSSSEASLLKDLSCPFASLQVGSVFFRSVYVAIEPTKALVDLNKLVNEAVGVEAKTPSFPHLSLCYISDEDAAKGERERYAQKVRELVEYVKCGEAAAGGTAELEIKLAAGWAKHFVAREIWIVRCEGPIQGWEPLKKIHLD